MNCQHDARRQYAYALGRKTTELCSDCLARVTAIGMALTLIDRREHDLTPVVERRHPRPRWLDRLTAREDGTWRAA